MKKKLLIILVLIAFILGGSIIINPILIKEDKKQEKEEAVSEEINWLRENVKIEIKPGTLTKNGVTIVITDTNDSVRYGYDDWYRIDKKESGEWKEAKKVNREYYVLGTDFVYYVNEKTKQVEFSTNWVDRYGELEPGEYRYVKRFGEINPQYYWVTFEITNE